MYVEDLCVVGLGRTRLATSVHDAGWASFTGMLEYKAARWGRIFARIDRFVPTSQTCSACGRVDGPKPLSVRSWTCPCGAVHDRDVNAAINVLAQGRWDNSNACGTRVRPALVPAPGPTSRREAGIRPGAARSTRGAEGIPALQGGVIVKVVFPARNFSASVEAWSTVFGTGPTFSSGGIERAPGEADFAVFKTADIEIGLTSLPWADEPLVMLDTNDVVESRRALIEAGAVGLGEIADGSLAPLGAAPVTNGDPETGIVDVPGARLAVVRLADGSKVGLRQSRPAQW